MSSEHQPHEEKKQVVTVEDLDSTEHDSDPDSDLDSDSSIELMNVPSVPQKKQKQKQTFSSLETRSRPTSLQATVMQLDLEQEDEPTAMEAVDARQTAPHMECLELRDSQYPTFEGLAATSSSSISMLQAPVPTPEVDQSPTAQCPLCCIACAPDSNRRVNFVVGSTWKDMEADPECAAEQACGHFSCSSCISN